MKQFKVIKEFPGLKVGDILTEDPGSGFYINYIENIDSTEDSQSIFVNSVALNESAVVENLGEYFEELPIEKEPEETEQEKLLSQMTQTAAYLENDVSMAINNYHREITLNTLNTVYHDISMLEQIIKTLNK